MPARLEVVGNGSGRTLVREHVFVGALGGAKLRIGYVAAQSPNGRRFAGRIRIDFQKHGLHEIGEGSRKAHDTSQVIDPTGHTLNRR